MADMIISKSKTKESVKECNVSGEFYSALDAKVREMIAAAEGYISTALHSPVTGTVKAIELRPHPNGQRMPSIVMMSSPSKFASCWNFSMNL